MDDQAANDCDLEHVAYEFFTQAFVLYEEEIAVIFPQLLLVIFWSINCQEKLSGSKLYYLFVPCF